MIKIKKSNPLVIFLVIIVLLIFLHATTVLAPLEDFLSILTRPLNSSLYNWSLSLKNFNHINSSQQELAAQVKQLTKKVVDLTVANSRCLEINDENKKLHSTLYFLKTNNFKAVVAKIIAKRASTIDNGNLIIDRGRRDGLRPGFAVVNEAGIIVGKIVQVKDINASFCLTTSINCQLAATIQNQFKTQGITAGDLGLTIKMSYIPKLEKIVSGDMIITSGLGKNIPRGLLIGKVGRVYNASNEVWQTATIEPLSNLNSLTIVSVIIP